MTVIKLKDCPEFISEDGCRLREVFNPLKQSLSLRYSLAHAIVAPGQTTLLHRLKTSEVYFIISGSGIMSIDGQKTPVGPGDTVYIPPQAKQCITNSGKVELVFVCMVDPAWKKEDEEVL